MKKKLFIINLEDSEYDTELIQATLESEGIACEIVRVETQTDFLAEMEKGAVDLILADYTLPAFDGLSALALSVDRYPDAPFIFVAGTMGEEIAIEALKRGATDYVLKHNLARLVPVVRRALHEFDDRRERIRMEKALQETNETLQALIQSAPLAIIALDPEGYVTLWNPAAEHTFGWDEREALGQFLPYVPEEKRDEFRMLRERVLNGEEFTDVEVCRRKKDGTPIDISISTAPLHDTQGSIAGIMSVVADITDRKQAEAQLKTSLAEKEVLLRELYHRTKNTMQVIRSMLMLHAARMPENEEAQKLVHNTDLRIMAMALVHQLLYQSQDLSHLNLHDYLEELSHQVVQSDARFAQRIALTLDIEPVAVLLDTALPCGLLLNELLTNALRHAFPAERTGTIVIKLFRNENGLLELHIADNGVGVPQGFDFRQEGNLGMQMIIALAEHQLHGTIKFTSGQDGVTCQVVFSDTFYSPRV